MSFLPKIWESLEGAGSNRCRVTYHDKLAIDIFDTVEAVVVLTLAESVRVDVGGEVAHGSSDALIECAAESEVAAETHARGALRSSLSVPT